MSRSPIDGSGHRQVLQSGVARTILAAPRGRSRVAGGTRSPRTRRGDRVLATGSPHLAIDRCRRHAIVVAQPEFSHSTAHRSHSDDQRMWFPHLELPLTPRCGPTSDNRGVLFSAPDTRALGRRSRRRTSLGACVSVGEHSRRFRSTRAGPLKLVLACGGEKIASEFDYFIRDFDYTTIGRTNKAATAANPTNQTTVSSASSRKRTVSIRTA